MAEYLDLSGLQYFYSKLQNEFATKSEIQTTVKLIISSSSPEGNSQTLWINTLNQTMNYWDGQQWIALGAVWK